VNEERSPQIVVMTRAGRMIGVSVEDGPDAAMVRSVLASVAGVCDAADERAAYEVRGCHVDGPVVSYEETVKLLTWTARWYPMGIPFGAKGR